MKTLGATALALLTTLCLSLAALSGWAADPAKLPDGLRGVPWGASLKSLPDMAPVQLPRCRCGDVLKGVIHPPECPFFGNECTPRNPLGPCMVSSEGSCAARYKYG